MFWFGIKHMLIAEEIDVFLTFNSSQYFLSSPYLEVVFTTLITTSKSWRPISVTFRRLETLSPRYQRENRAQVNSYYLLTVSIAKVVWLRWDRNPLSTCSEQSGDLPPPQKLFSLRLEEIRRSRWGSGYFSISRRLANWTQSWKCKPKRPMGVFIDIDIYISL